MAGFRTRLFLINMKYVDNLLTPQIKSKNVSYKELVKCSRSVIHPGEDNKVVITSKRIDIFGKTEEEIRQGKNYIKQLRILLDGYLPVCEFEFFSPAFKHRGFLIDVCRHFMAVDELKRIINVMALCGYNIFHWHLTDDQAWRFKVEGYEKLEKISCKRPVKEYNHHDITHEGIYSDEDLKDIVSFCSERGVAVIPEIEMPGHATALLAAYPEFGCTGNKIQVETRWGIFDDVMNPASKALWKFLDAAVKKLASIFPGPYIHIGGDECPHGQWEENKKCKRLMKKNHLKDSNELQGWFTSKAAKIVSSYGKRALGWDEVVDAPEIDKSVIVMSWRGLNGARVASSRGHNVILCPEQGCYFDKGYTDDSFEPKQWGTYSVKDTFNIDLSMNELPEEQRALILGAQCNVWTEQIHNGREAEYMMFPRAFVLADSLWLGENKVWARVVQRKRAMSDLCYNLDLVCSPARWEK